MQYSDDFSPSQSKLLSRHDLAFPECRENERNILAAPSMGDHTVRATIVKHQKIL